MKQIMQYFFGRGESDFKGIFIELDFRKVIKLLIFGTDYPHSQND